jgi:hypothetical protein
VTLEDEFCRPQPAAFGIIIIIIIISYQKRIKRHIKQHDGFVLIHLYQPAIETFVAMTRVVKMIGVHGVQYVVVDEGSPLLTRNKFKRSTSRDTVTEVSHITSRQKVIIFSISIMCAVGAMAFIGPFSSTRWPLYVHRGRGFQSSTEADQEGDSNEQRCDGFMCYERAHVRVPEDLPNFPSFWKYAEHGPINVTFDERAIMLNGERSLFLAGSLHPVRATRETWTSALDAAVRQGINMVTIYIFWSTHQPFPGTDFDWSFPGDWDLATAIRAAANRGLFVHIRIGPYACGEYSYGGIPEWLPLDKPNMVMRRLNKEWMEAMEKFVVATVNYLTVQRLWAYQGGPIVMSQIENELGGEEFVEDSKHLLAVEVAGDHTISPSDSSGMRPGTLQDYADWCGELASRVAPNVVWTMCNGLTAPNTINTCNGYGDAGCSRTWLEINGQSGRIQVDQPALWTEDEQGFQIWGDEPSNPSDYFWGNTARQMAREGLQWFARGGSHLNYYMLWGGYNRGRAAAAGIMNMYASDACICPSGQLRQPKYGHFKEFHEAIISIAPILMGTKSALRNEQAIEYLTNDGEWKVGDQQRMFVYSEHAREDESGSSESQIVQFVENDATSAVVVRIPASWTGETQTLDMNPLSAAVLADGMLLFDSGTINPRYKSFGRRTVPNAMTLLDWTTWTEPIGAKADDANTVTASRPIEQTSLMMSSKTFSDFAWYETDLNLNRNLENAVVLIETQKANALSIFIDDQFVQAMDNHEHSDGNIALSAFIGTISAGQHTLSILSESLGYHNLIGRWGADTKPKTKGITGDVVISGKAQGSDTRCTESIVDEREWRSYPGLHEKYDARRQLRVRSKVSPHDFLSACNWASVLFDTPDYDSAIQALYLDITSGRGRLWLNGFDLGRFWNITRGDTDEYSQRYYFLPNELLYSDGKLNELVIFNALDGDNSATNLVLSWLEMDENSSLEDEVDFPSACI